MILDLAVCGLLVPQDPADEPASELLKRIEAEKAKLPKKGKPLPPIGEDEVPFTLPLGWAWVRLEQVSRYIQRGKGPQYTDRSDWVVISQKCVRWQGLDIKKARFITSESLDKYDEVRFLNPGDILWNSTGTGTIGRAIVVPEICLGRQWVVDSHVTVVRLVQLVPEFVWRWIQSPTVQSEIESSASGTTNQIELATSTVVAHLVPLPPLAEQHRIVAKVDELMALCDSLEAQQGGADRAHAQLVKTLLETLTQARDANEFAAHWQRLSAHFDALFTTEASVDALKQTILQLALRGQLVKQDPNDEPASELLKRIEAEKAKQPKKGKSLPPIDDEEKPFELPVGWEYVRLGTAIEFLNGFAFKTEWYQKTGIKLLRNINIGHEDIVWTDSVCISEARLTEFERFSLSAGDLVLSLDRPIISTGLKCAVVSEQDLPCLLLQRVAKFVSLGHLVDVCFILNWLKSDFFMKSIDPGRSNGVPHISTTQIAQLSFPLPPLAEQQRIVAKVDELMALCDTLKQRLARAREVQGKLAMGVAPLERRHEAHFA